MNNLHEQNQQDTTSSNRSGAQLEQVINKFDTRFSLPKLNKYGNFIGVVTVYDTISMKTLYALKRNGKDVVTVEMDVPDFVPRTTINREWLKGVVTEELVQKQPVRRIRNTRPAKRTKARV